jgi:hypothetical protein
VKNSSENNKILSIYLFIWWQEKKWLYDRYKTHMHTHKTKYSIYIYNMRLKNELGYLLKMNQQIDLTQLYI